MVFTPTCSLVIGLLSLSLPCGQACDNSSHIFWSKQANVLHSHSVSICTLFQHSGRCFIPCAKATIFVFRCQALRRSISYHARLRSIFLTTSPRCHRHTSAIDEEQGDEHDGASGNGWYSNLGDCDGGDVGGHVESEPTSAKICLNKRA